jgi:hypothetical protein
MEKRRHLIIPMHTSYSPDLPPAVRSKLMTRDGVLARMVENGEIAPWLPMSPADADFLESRVNKILALPPEQKPTYLDDYVFQTQRPKAFPTASPLADAKVHGPTLR